jgi:hypothetical protein
LELLVEITILSLWFSVVLTIVVKLAYLSPLIINVLTTSGKYLPTMYELGGQ